MFLRALFLLLISAQIVFAADCDDCTPLAEVSVTNKGLEKLLTASIEKNLGRIEDRVNRSAKFRDLQIDRSKCPTIPVREAIFSKNKVECYGMPHINEDASFSMDTPLRPYVADFKNMKLDVLDIGLAKPVKCENFRCDYEVKVKKALVSGELTAKYTDKNETIVPPLTVFAATTETSHATISGRVTFNPKTGRLNDLAEINEEDSRINMPPGSVRLGMDLNYNYATPEDKTRMRSKHFQRVMRDVRITDEYVESNYNAFIEQAEQDMRTHIVTSRAENGLAPLTDKELRKVAQLTVSMEIKDKHGSPAALKRKMRQLKLPSANDPQAAEAYLDQMPEIATYFPDLRGKALVAELGSYGENTGFTNPGAFTMTMVGILASNQALGSEFITDKLVKPTLEKEIFPLVHREVNGELRRMKEYWDKASKLPNIDLQYFAKYKELQDRLKEAKTDAQRAAINAEIEAVKHAMNMNWVPIDTEVIIDQNTRNGKILRAQITNGPAHCHVSPAFSNDTKDDYDIRTELNPKTLQEFFNNMFSKKQSLCLDSDDVKTCKGGTRIDIKKPPKVSCENGDTMIEFDAGADKGIFDVDVHGRVKAAIDNCDGNPCLKIKDAKGRFKNVLINFFFGPMLDRAMRSVASDASGAAIDMRYLKLNKRPKTERNCSTKLDWDVKQDVAVKP